MERKEILFTAFPFTNHFIHEALHLSEKVEKVKSVMLMYS